MIIVMSSGATGEQVESVIEKVHSFGLRTHPIYGVQKTVIGIIGDEKTRVVENMQGLPGVESIIPILQPYKFAGREAHPDPTVIDVGGVKIGGVDVAVIAGPCAVESEEQLMEIAPSVKKSGARVLRGGAYKPRTSPYSFQGLGEEALKLLARARDETGLPVITEVTDPRNVELVSTYADILQVGARNMQNFVLLTEVGKSGHPVMLKRGPSATVKDLLLAAEYMIIEGNSDVILCERGITTFETNTRNTLDLSAVPVIKQLSHLPVVVDPSHSTGRSFLVEPMSLAAVAAGADGIMVEVHPDPDSALCDGPQALTLQQFDSMMVKLRAIASIIGRGA
ncbi:MAG: 3-deoxy-7-phosphoheptulonate synthase [Actinobacteria bacterium]|nr:3-deoxy-7-phosphoheptulonate synthase [Actinomycetota bacterium]MBU4240763.1 3-deoxy-7-phosphoheptulonate synthase [Actinomycetota bacterium]MBU4302284.1 3-deoxy-7-phosphoheptulonate synthase [Actinomycetota bacterium]MBU4489244.1 3-deoxy-7-phosphoheptulonate synthase [Actinomycetota bacterium]MCG2795142.1 3-deoxy-7-phosphoheptulonate synthase [Actinomycetes bacterium]